MCFLTFITNVAYLTQETCDHSDMESDLDDDRDVLTIKLITYISCFQGKTKLKIAQ